MAPKKSKNEEVQDKKKTSSVQVVINSLKNKFGDEVIDWLGKTKEVERQIIPSGSYGLDYCLGVGGYVRGRFYEIFGPESVGKSTLAYSALKEARKLGLKCLYVDAEHTLDKRLLAQMGADPDNIVYVHGYTGEQNLDIAEAIMQTGDIGLCVVDSIAALLPTSEANLASFDDQTIGVHSRLISRMCRVFVPLAAKTSTAVLCINQTRNKIGAYGDPTTTTGGNALKFYCTARIKVSGGHAQSSRITDANGEAVGHRVKVYMEKNKLAVPRREAEADLIYGFGIDTFGEIIDIATDLSILERRGAYYYYEGTNLGQGKPNAINKIKSDPALFSLLEAAVKETAGLGKKKIVVPEEDFTNLPSEEELVEEVETEIDE